MIEIPVSYGELLDRISIITLKFEATGKDTFFEERAALIKIARNHFTNRHDEVYCYIERLTEVNERLWEAEDNIRTYNDEKWIGEDFVKTAKIICQLNDERFALKKEINEKFDSGIKEEKIYGSGVFSNEG
jgi:hypothetical protein